MGCISYFEAGAQEFSDLSVNFHSLGKIFLTSSENMWMNFANKFIKHLYKILENSKISHT